MAPPVAAEVLSSPNQRVGEDIRLLVRFYDPTAGTPTTGLTPVVHLTHPVLNGGWWDDTNKIWEVNPVDIELDEIDSTTMPGVYGLELNYSELDPTNTEQLWLLIVKKESIGQGLAAQAIHAQYHLGYFKLAADAPVEANVLTLQHLLTALRVFLVGDVVTDDASKQLIRVCMDGTTPALAFDLTDAAGMPSVREPFNATRAAI